jgi:diguanylate cyclase (GGDEF)-like protein/PAS domain S-box-containing protein
MNLNFYRERSLKTRLTLFTLVIFLVSLWSLAIFASSVFQQDVQKLLGEQQFSNAASMAKAIDDRLRDRINALEASARTIDSNLLAQAGPLQHFLEQRFINLTQFNAGVFVMATDMKTLAGVPLSAGLAGIDSSGRDYALGVLKKARVTISEPFISPELHSAAFVIAVPILDARGTVIGALAGVTNLGLPNFLDTMTDTEYGEFTTHLLISPRQRLVISATEKNRIMERLPALGQSPVLDRFVAGYEGSAVFVDTKGVEVLASFKTVPLTGWYAASILPTAAAFAPLHAMQQRMLLGTILMTLAASALTWWMLRRQLAPLQDAARTLANLAQTEQFPSALTVARQDEIGDVITGFNHLLDTLHEREILLNQILDNSNVAIFLVDLNGCIAHANQRMADMFGTSVAALIGCEYISQVHPAQREIGRQLMLQLLTSAVNSTDVERLYCRPDQSEFWGHLTGRRFYDSKGHDRGIVAVLEDITERKKAQTKVSESEERFRTLIEESPSAITVHRDGKILYVNPAAAKLYGASSAQQVVGKAVLDLVHPDFRAVVRKRIEQVSQASSVAPLIEQKFLRLDGTDFDVEAQGNTIIYDGAPAIRTAFRDITERRLAHERLQLAASVFTHAREAIVITDGQGLAIDVNEAFERITGYSRIEALGQNPRLMSSELQSKQVYATMWRELKEYGHWYGEILNQRKNGQEYPAMLTVSAVCDEQSQVRHYVSLFTDITAIKAHEHELEHIAHFDALTNLPNRVLLADRLQQGMVQTQRRSQRLAVAYLDLDGFKSINDRHGHEAGDLLLKTVASRMKQALREGDTLARIGGDEFVAVLLDLTDHQASVPMLQRLLDAAAEHMQCGEQELQVSASLGVTFYPQSEEVEADQLLRQSDQAMYQAKQAGKNRYHFFDAEQDRTARGHFESIERIRQALGAAEFVLYYQPKVNMRTGAIIGVEALIRWQHPQHGLLAPALFLPVIEDHPLAVDIGEWVIATALAQIEIWQSMGLNVPVSVNVGARQLQQPGFVTKLRELLNAYPAVQPFQLEIEVLETSALDDLVGVSQVIEDCRALGVLFAMDDFGTGYSSLTYLKRLQVNLLKIDRSFVRDMLDDPDDLAILQGVIGLAGAFRRDVIAEGVETIAHGTLLLQLGCDLAQGFAIARPMPAEQLPAWALAWQRDAAWIAIGAN